MREPIHSSRPRLALTIVLTILFVAALLFGAGPGVLLVNAPEPLFGLPAIYLWGLLWYTVQVGVVMAAYLWCWRNDDTSDDRSGE